MDGKWLLNANKLQPKMKWQKKGSETVRKKKGIFFH